MCNWPARPREILADDKDTGLPWMTESGWVGYYSVVLESFERGSSSPRGVSHRRARSRTNSASNLGLSALILRRKKIKMKKTRETHFRSRIKLSRRKIFSEGSERTSDLYLWFLFEILFTIYKQCIDCEREKNWA